MSVRLDRVGTRIGDRVITGLVKDSEDTDKVIWGWKCDCGEIGATMWHTIKGAKQCRKCYETGSEIGKRFGSIVVTGMVPQGKGGTLYEKNRMLLIVRCERCGLNTSRVKSDWHSASRDDGCVICYDVALGPHGGKLYSLLQTEDGPRAAIDCPTCGHRKVVGLYTARQYQRAKRQRPHCQPKKQEGALKRRRGERLYDIDGVEMTSREISTMFGTPPTVFRHRLEAGWNTLDAATKPLRLPRIASAAKQGHRRSNDSVQING
jgi:ribosomal protein S27E